MYLMILEVSQKQAYIFASRSLADNCIRSQQIADATGMAFFLKNAPELFGEENMVYSGGGHTVLQFASEAQGKAFAETISRAVMRCFPGMELYIRMIPYDSARSPSENLLALSRALEEKKALRRASFRSLSLGIEQTSGTSSAASPAEPFLVPGWKWEKKTDQIAGDDNFIAVVHLDGNAMGKRVQGIYEACGNDWDATVRALQTFSSQIDAHYAEAFRQTVMHLVSAIESDSRFENRVLPVRKLIGAGDDVCFITRGYLGLDFAADFMQNLSTFRNDADGKYYSACAGVVLIHTSAPFRQTYDLSEALCSNAKQFAAAYGGEINALDYHIEYGQISDSLSLVRQNYIADDGLTLTLRPRALNAAPGIPEERLYQGLIQDMARVEASGIARGKIKGLRIPMHQGAPETDLAIRMGQSGKLLRAFGVSAVEGNDSVRQRLFDAIELSDRTEFWRETK